MIEIAVFGGGCFWCTEAVFKMMKGVQSVTPGYSGGTIENPTYEEVCAGRTGHVEVIKIEYDPNLVSYEDLLTVFFGSHDPTSVNRQGNDIGEQYKSVIFTISKKQSNKAREFIKNINKSSLEGKEVVTDVLPLENFYEAEGYHKDYFDKNPGNPYCEIVINPKLEKVKKYYSELLKSIYE